jgi:uncharacterized protein (DUF1330 family)
MTEVSSNPLDENATRTFVDSTGEQLAELARDGLSGPVVMLNLLRFRPGTGRERYAEYGRAMRPLLAAAGARIVWHGRADSVVIGDDDADGWDDVVLVEYPSRSTFLSVVRSPEYREIGKLRSAALVDSRLIACRELTTACRPVDR